MLPSKIELYTYMDYINKKDDKSFELIDGKFYAMSPAPSRIHQKIVTELSRRIGNFIEINSLPCEVYVAPFDVRLVNEGEREEDCINVVQPDISIICDKTKLDDKGCKGAPEFIIEVVSASNSSLDYVKKLYLYEKFKVNEYWIINPETSHILIYRLNDINQYSEPDRFSFDENMESSFLKGFQININSIVNK